MNEVAGEFVKGAKLSLTVKERGFRFKDMADYLTTKNSQSIRRRSLMDQ